MVHEAVEDGAGGGGGAEDLAPIGEGEVARDEGAAALVAFGDDLEEEVGAGRVDGEVTELVEDEQTRSDEGREAVRERSR